jgi:hypothetical protein
MRDRGLRHSEACVGVEGGIACFGIDTISFCKFESGVVIWMLISCQVESV